jgi:HAD domain in Swiss Army Knife RNA repair proteins
MRQPRNTVPILFLDVDGVISLFGFDADRAPEGRFHWINGVVHYISPSCGMRLSRLEERFELVWATGWEEAANEYLPHLLGLPEALPVLTFEGRASFGTAHWKIDAIDEYAGPTRPLAWIDDCFDGSCRAWAEQRSAPTLLVQTDSAEGMLDVHVDRLYAWADELALRPAYS